MSEHPYDLLWDFQTSFGQPAYTVPGIPNQPRRDLRKALLQEEYEEYLDGEATNDLTAIADALIDMTYIIFGTGIEYGLPMKELFDEVHRSNMSKLDPATGKPIYREDGKVMKPPSYSPPDLASIIAYHQSPVEASITDYGVFDRGEACSDDCSVPDEGEASCYSYRSAPERIAVYVNVGSLSREKAKEMVEDFKTEILGVAKDRGDDAIYYFIPTTEPSRIERL